MSILFPNVLKFILFLPRLVKRFIVISLDVCLCALSVWLAFYLRLGEFVDLIGSARWAVLVSVFFALPIFVRSGFYRAIFRHSNLSVLLFITRATVLYGVLYAMVFTVVSIPGVPRTVGIIQPILLLLMVGTSRIVAWL